MRKLQDLTLREKIGQLIMAGLRQKTSMIMCQMVKEAKIGNIILFTEISKCTPIISS